MPGHVDVARAFAPRAQSDGQVRLDDPRWTLGTHQRCVLDRNALAALEPRRRCVHRCAGLDHRAPAAVQDLMNNLLHPRCPALHLGNNEYVFGGSSPGGGTLEALDAAAASWRGCAPVLYANAAEVSLDHARVEPQKRRQQEGVPSQRTLEGVALAARPTVVVEPDRALVPPFEDGGEVETHPYIRRNRGSNDPHEPDHALDVDRRVGRTQWRMWR